MRNSNAPRRPSRSKPVAEERDAAFDDFISGVGVSPEELAAMTRMPGYSILEIREYLQQHSRAASAKGRAKKLTTVLENRAE